MKLIDLFENDHDHNEALKKTGFWGKAGAGGIIIAKDTNRVLLGYRSSLVEQPHTWAGFGGAIDSDENPKAAALREITEETQLPSSLITSIVPSYTFSDSRSGFRYYNFIVEVSREFKPVLNWENKKADWFKLSDLPNNLHFGLSSLLNSSEFKSYARKSLV